MRSIILLFLALLLFSCEYPAIEETDFSIHYYDVKYEVTGSAITVSTTIENEDGGTSQFADVAVPWTYQFEGRQGDFVYVSAQNQGDTGSVTVTIYYDGDVFKTSTSSGAYVIATAYGSLPD